ncbi:hypothetical protein [Vagococcus intermedius]|uniref:Uncharacterized protein n=1 Tax=Vagococcus intermedius TaxID=2991418 RepID=A0AAF0I7F7_9ENTE|nr:hypothetical protein [Vagococcus intermedius]WEG73304.1 hypothetical protein OL234_10270 [Vagococcus intermedius]WEG75385.1 hypothetical protein OL235_10265 [Vagococcus intermedius]
MLEEAISIKSKVYQLAKKRDKDNTVVLRKSAEDDFRLSQLVIACQRQAVPRELFIPASYRLIAYWGSYFSDFPLHEVYYEWSDDERFSLVTYFVIADEDDSARVTELKKKSAKLFKVCLEEVLSDYERLDKKLRFYQQRDAQLVATYPWLSKKTDEERLEDLHRKLVIKPIAKMPTLDNLNSLDLEDEEVYSEDFLLVRNREKYFSKEESIVTKTEMEQEILELFRKSQNKTIANKKRYMSKESFYYYRQRITLLPNQWLEVSEFVKAPEDKRFFMMIEPYMAHLDLLLTDLSITVRPKFILSGYVTDARTYYKLQGYTLLNDYLNLYLRLTKVINQDEELPFIYS